MGVRHFAAISIMTVAIAGIAFATPIRIPVDVAQSNLTVELCLQGTCDSDTSPTSGYWLVKLAPPTAPTSVQFYDFRYTLTEPIDLLISFGFLGRFTATGNNLEFFYATPLVPLAPAAVSGGSFADPSVPTQGSGTINYQATGIVCTLLQGQVPPIPCTDAIDLSQEPPNAGPVNGTVSVSPARVVTFVTNVNNSAPIDPANPGLGTLTTTGTARGSVAIPLRGDANLDGSVNALDVQQFVTVLLDPASATWQARFAVDMNDDDAFDGADAAALAECLLGNSCPD